MSLMSTHTKCIPLLTCNNHNIHIDRSLDIQDRQVVYVCVRRVCVKVWQSDVFKSQKNAFGERRYRAERYFCHSHHTSFKCDILSHTSFSFVPICDCHQCA